MARRMSFGVGMFRVVKTKYLISLKSYMFIVNNTLEQIKAKFNCLFVKKQSVYK